LTLLKVVNADDGSDLVIASLGTLMIKVSIGDFLMKHDMVIEFAHCIFILVVP